MKKPYRVKERKRREKGRKEEKEGGREEEREGGMKGGKRRKRNRKERKTTMKSERASFHYPLGLDSTEPPSHLRTSIFLFLPAPTSLRSETTWGVQGNEQAERNKLGPLTLLPAGFNLASQSGEGKMFATKPS
jgi:hypothetical protein